MDLGSYDYVQRVYNRNMVLPDHRLPKTAADGDQRLLNDGTLTLTMHIRGGQVTAITIHTTAPTSRVYMQVFEGFEFGVEAVGIWLETYHTALQKGQANGIVKGIEARYTYAEATGLTVTLRRVADLDQ
ncbi:hypothetical protein [Lacticaseibacillus yichunensis]|uniref:DUF3237 domain-containing protein n=1 Tax=Lacticaseibacillus yichunensis TaxID=2486015 RepID=A0ABW4CNG7_9LACO|nr:hypothetical protein [Lacticaseibacillus yichunensis]